MRQVGILLVIVAIVVSAAAIVRHSMIRQQVPSSYEREAKTIDAETAKLMHEMMVITSRPHSDEEMADLQRRMAALRERTDEFSRRSVK